MASGKAVAATLIAMTVVAVFIGPLANVTANNTGVEGVNETVTIQTDEYTDLSGWDLTNNVTVTTGGGTTTLTEGTDYELNSTVGSIIAVDGSANVADGDTVRVVYEYEATDSTTETIAGLLPLFAALLIIGTVSLRIRKMM